MRKSVDRGYPKHVKLAGGENDNIVAAFKYVCSRFHIHLIENLFQAALYSCILQFTF